MGFMFSRLLGKGTGILIQGSLHIFRENIPERELKAKKETRQIFFRRIGQHTAKNG
jgi:hypothetical protein